MRFFVRSMVRSEHLKLCRHSHWVSANTTSIFLAALLPAHSEKPQTIILFFPMPFMLPLLFLLRNVYKKRRVYIVWAMGMFKQLGDYSVRVFRCSKSTRDASDYSKYGTYGQHVMTILIFCRAVAELLCLHLLGWFPFQIVCVCVSARSFLFQLLDGYRHCFCFVRRHEEEKKWFGFVSGACTLLLFSSSSSTFRWKNLF